MMELGLVLAIVIEQEIMDNMQYILIMGNEYVNT